MKKYEYLIYSCIFLSLLIFALHKRKDLKPHIILPCVAGAIIGPVSELVYFKDYWHPYTILGQSVPGVEDIIFGSSVIGLSLLAYPLIFKRHEWQRHHKRHALFSLGYLSIGAVILVALIKLLGVDSVYATAIACLVLLLPIVIIRRDIIKPALVSGLIMAALAGIIYYILLGFVFRDALQNVWLLNNTLLGYKLFSYIPVSELIWFFTVGSFLEAFDIFVSETHFRRFARKRSTARPTAKNGATE